jgi:cell division GTPase FtsZ
VNQPPVNEIDRVKELIDLITRAELVNLEFTDEKSTLKINHDCEV